MKRFLPLLLALVCLVCLVSCTKAVQIDAVAAADRLAEELVFADVMTGIDTDIVLRAYVIDAAAVKAARGYMSTGATAEEIAVFEAVDADAAQTVKAAVEKRIADQKDGYADYRPEEVPKLNEAVVVVEGNYVFFVVAEDSQTARGLVNTILGK